jgi:hypothetical protein
MKNEYMKFPYFWIQLMEGKSDSEKNKIIIQLVRYYFFNEDPSDMAGFHNEFEYIIKPFINRCKNGHIYGKKGGAPKGNQNAKKNK